jgi:glycosyltransferase involved in cell wall biosynthesis
MIIIPCFNEADRLDLRTLIRYATSHDHQLLLINDGSTDATGDMLDDLAATVPEQLTVLHQLTNCGKAEAVRQGMLRAWESKPQYVGYWDADLATPLDTVDEFVRHLDTHEHVNIVLGARVRLLGKQIERRITRHCLGRLFATAAAATLRLPVYDTQCGAKLLRNTEHVRMLFDEPFATKWLFDVELLARYLALAEPTLDRHALASTIHELPLSYWRDVAGSKVRPTDFVRAAWQLAMIHRIYRRRARRRCDQAAHMLVAAAPTQYQPEPEQSSPLTSQTSSSPPAAASQQAVPQTTEPR